MKKTDREQKLWLLAGGLGCILLVVVDQVSKNLAVSNLAGGENIVLIPGIFCLTYVENFGAAFGTWTGFRVFLLVMTAGLVLYMLMVYLELLKRTEYKAARVVCIFLISGGLGNIIDRAVRGYVVDFFYLEFINFPVFNVADCYITGAIAVFILLLFTAYRDSELDFLVPSCFRTLLGKRKERKDES